MTTIISFDDLSVLDPTLGQAEAAIMIDDAVAQATLSAPCLANEEALSATQRAQYKSILRGVILRWAQAGPANVVTTSHSDTAGPFSEQSSQTVDNSQARRGFFWPSEIDMLQRICSPSTRKSGTTNTIPGRYCGNQRVSEYEMCRRGILR